MTSTSSNRISPAMIGLVAAATLLSGAAGLIYEVVWSRMLVVPMGNSSDAVTVVLCSFMLGMALGARFIGALADRLGSPIRAYVFAEVFLAAYALVVPFLVPLLSDQGLDWMLRLGAGIVMVAIPAVAMGASMPVLVRSLSRTSEDIGRRAGIFYGFNTVGGAAGAAIAGFVAAPSLGLTVSSFAAAGLSATAAVVVFVASRFLPKGDARKGKRVPEKIEVPPRKVAMAALIAAGVGGFAMLGAEVLWARILTFVFGHDTYAFAILLVVVLAGMGLGGLIYRLLAKKDPGTVAAIMLVVLGFAVFVSYGLASSLIISLGRDPFAIGASAGLSTSLWVEFYRELAFAPILVLLPAIAAGVSLPAACALYSPGVDGSGKRVGTVILVNGIFAALGSVVTAFVLVPLIGIHYAFVTLYLLVMAGALVVTGMANGLSHLSRAKRIAAFAGLVLALSYTVYHFPSDTPRQMLQQAVGEEHQEILHYDEGRTGTVSVTKNKINGERQLFMNAVNEVTTRLVHDQSFKLLGHLGPLLHSEPDEGLMICFGAGISAGAALVHPLQSLDVVDLSSSIPRAAPFFDDVNNKVYEDPRLKLHIDDGRQYLLRSDREYDVIMVDSTHPKSVDSWVLYTAEFYQLVFDHLADDGIAVQWVPLHGLSESEFKIIVRTFQSVFDQTTVWVNVGEETYGQVAYVKLVGTKEPLAIDYGELELRLKEPRIRADLAPYGMDDTLDILDSFLAGPAAVKSWTEGLPVQTDDMPFLPYITGYSEGRRMAPALLLAVRSSVTPHLYRMGDDEKEISNELSKVYEAQGFLLAGMNERAAEAWPEGKKFPLFAKRAAGSKLYYLALAEMYPDDPEKLFEIGSYLGNLGFGEEAFSLYERARKKGGSSSRLEINRALVLMDLGKVGEAVKILSDVAGDDPDNPLARYNLGVALLQSGDAASARDQLERAVEIDPKLYGAALSLAEAHRMLGKLGKAEAILRDLTRRAKWMPEAWDMLGLVMASKGDWPLAQQFHSKALILDPYRARYHYNMGIALQEQGRLRAAAQAYLAAIRLEPKDAEAHNNLGLVYGGAGLFDKAAEQHREALDIEPHYPEAAFNLGLAYKGMGRPMLAAEAFALAKELAPDLEEAREQLEQLGIEDARIQITDGGVEQSDGSVDGGR